MLNKTQKITKAESNYWQPLLSANVILLGARKTIKCNFIDSFLWRRPGNSNIAYEQIKINKVIAIKQI